MIFWHHSNEVFFINPGNYLPCNASIVFLIHSLCSQTCTSWTMTSVTFWTSQTSPPSIYTPNQSRTAAPSRSWPPHASFALASLTPCPSPARNFAPPVTLRRHQALALLLNSRRGVWGGTGQWRSPLSTAQTRATSSHLCLMAGGCRRVPQSAWRRPLWGTEGALRSSLWMAGWPEEEAQASDSAVWVDMGWWSITFGRGSRAAESV